MTAGVPDVLRSCERGVAELEYACRFDCRQVLAARCALLGLSDVAVLTAAIVALPALAGADPFLALRGKVPPLALPPPAGTPSTVPGPPARCERAPPACRPRGGVGGGICGGAL